MATLTLAGAWCSTRTIAQAADPRIRTIVTTNYIVVTNMVLVTNCVTETGSTSGPVASPFPPGGALTNEVKLPPMPMTDDADWVQLKSGEWLRGKIRGFRNLKLEFDSDKLKDQTFDWKDVSQLYSPSAYCLYGEKETAVGTVHVEQETVTVSGTRNVIFLRDELLGLSPGAPRERDYWSGKLGLGLNLRSGNTEEVDLTTSFTLQRRTPNTDLKLDAVGNYSELEGVENVSNFRGTLSYGVNLTRRIFVIPLFGEYYRDAFQNIAHRGTVGIGGGYYFYKRPTLEWLAFLGPAYQYTIFDTVQAGGSADASTPALLLGTRFDKDLTRHIHVELSYQGIVTSQEAGLMTHHSVSTLSVDLTRLLDLNLSFIWDRIEEPQANSDGTFPKKDDFRLTLSLGVKF